MMKTYLFNPDSRLFVSEQNAAAGDVPGSWVFPPSSTAVPPPATVPPDKLAQWTGAAWKLIDKISYEADAKKQEEQQTALEKAPAALAVTKLLARTAAASMPDATAIAVSSVLPDAFRAWMAGETYSLNEIVTRDGQTYRVCQAVTGQAHQPPGAAGMLAIYRPIVPVHAGTATDPIPFIYGMDALTGKYYSSENKVYLCKGDMKPCTWNPGTAGLWQWEFVRNI